MMEQAVGKLIFCFIEVVILTVPVSLALLLWYRRMVNREMRAPSSAARSPSPLMPSPDGGGSQPSIAHGTEHSPAGIEVHASDRVRLRVAIVYTIAGMCASAVLTAIWCIPGDTKWTPLQIFVIWYANCWPVIPTLAALIVFPQRKALLAFAGYAFVGMVAVGSATIIGHAIEGNLEWTNVLPNAGRFIGFLLNGAFVAFAIILITSNRRLRAVSAPVLASLAVFGFTTLASSELFVAAYDYEWVRQRGLVRLGEDGWFLVMAVPAGFICWLILKRLGHQFVEKDFSDVQLLVDAWWFIVTLLACVELASQSGWWGLTGLLAFAVYRGVVSIGLRVWRQDGYPRTGPRLLLLRVFGFQTRTEQLFDTVASRWRLIGCVTMIGAADLAMRTVSLPRLVSFLSDRFGEDFVRDEPEVGGKVAGIDEQRDPDGRFRIAELFCHDNSWRATLDALLKRTDIVLMDLRSFSRTNLGCIFELERLAATRTLVRSLLVVDDTTDLELLEATFARTRTAGMASIEHEKLPLFRIGRNARVDHVRIYRALCELAVAPS